MAMSHAEHPEQAAPTLKQERVGCGIDDADLDTAVAAARMDGKSCHLPGAIRIVARIAEDMRLMAAPVLGEKPNGLAARVEGLLEALPVTRNDLLDLVSCPVSCPGLQI
jgi:hypothetical protein